MTTDFHTPSHSVLIRHAEIYTGQETPEGLIQDGAVLVENGIITAVFSGSTVSVTGQPTQIIDLQGRRLAPGLVDIQINGGYESYFSKDPNAATLDDISRACADHATLHFLPTLISSPLSTIETALHSIRDYIRQYPENGVIGMHLEGPYFNPRKRGAHSAAIIRKPTDQELEKIVAAGKDLIKVMTLAPELFADEQLQYLQQQGITLSAGHSAMSYEQAMHYFDKGIHLVTHLYNAMSGFTPRDPGFIGAALERTDLWCPIIMDGHHLHYAAARLAHKTHPETLFLITDSSFLGRQMQVFTWEGFDAKLTGGTYRNQEGHLAGAAISMTEALQNTLGQLPVTEQVAIAMATSRPARAIGMDDQIGYIAPGYPARFSVFDEGFTNMESLLL